MRFELTEMDFGTILDHGIKLYKDKFTTIITIVAIFIGPFNLALSFAGAYLNRGMNQSSFLDWYMTSLRQMLKDPGSTPGPDPAMENLFSDPNIWTSIGIVYGVAIILSLITPLAYLSVYRILAQYLVGIEASVKDSVKFAASSYWILIGAAIITGIAVSIISTLFMCLCIVPFRIAGTIFAVFFMILCIVPSIIFLILFTAYMVLLPCVITMEKVDTMSSLKRTWALLKGYWWRTAGIYFLAAIIIGIINATFSSVGNALTSFIPGIPGMAAASAIASLFSIIFTPVVWVIMFLVYIDIRIRKENFDLDILAQRTIGPMPTKQDKFSAGQPPEQSPGQTPDDTWK